MESERNLGNERPEMIDIPSKMKRGSGMSKDYADAAQSDESVSPLMLKNAKM